MALVSSAMLPLGTALPAFELEDTVSGKIVSNQDFEDRPLVVAIICNHCPYVRRIKRGLAQLGEWLHEEEVPFVAASCNDADNYPDDGPDRMAEEAREHAYCFPYLFDQQQRFAQALRAMATPEFYVFDEAARLVYRGQMDDARPNNSASNDGRDIKEAVRRLKAGEPPLTPQKPSIGCSIKWLPGNTPAYAQ